MKWRLKVSFRNMKSSATIEDWILEEADKLDTFYDQILGCRVAVEVPHRHHRKGSVYHIRINLTVPGKEIVVAREPSLASEARQLGETEAAKHLELNIPHKNLHQAIKDAFKVAGRRLKEYADCQRGEVKTHLAPAGVDAREVAHEQVAVH